MDKKKLMWKMLVIWLMMLLSCVMFMFFLWELAIEPKLDVVIERGYIEGLERCKKMLYGQHIFYEWDINISVHVDNETNYSSVSDNQSK